MTERPILFSAPMVRAILEGRKTQTRRVIKAPLEIGEDDNGKPWPFYPAYVNDGDNEGELANCPYGSVGDRLWVRAAHALDGKRVFYRAGHEESAARGPRVDVRWRPSIHMPRWASRITLEITDVRVQRLQEISEEDARAEGADPVEEEVHGHPSLRYRAAFHSVWTSIHGFESWSANPWVWALTFKKIEEATR